MTNRNIASVNIGVFAEQLPRAVELHVELGINHDKTLLEKSRLRSRDRLLFCH